MSNVPNASTRHGQPLGPDRNVPLVEGYEEDALTLARLAFQKREPQLYEAVYRLPENPHRHDPNKESRFTCPFARMFHAEHEHAEDRHLLSLENFRRHLAYSSAHCKALNQVPKEFRARTYVMLEVNSYALGVEESNTLFILPEEAEKIARERKHLERSPSPGPSHHSGAQETSLERQPSSNVRELVPLAENYSRSSLVEARNRLKVQDPETYMAVYQPEAYAKMWPDFIPRAQEFKCVIDRWLTPDKARQCRRSDFTYKSLQTLREHYRDSRLHRDQLNAVPEKVQATTFVELEVNGFMHHHALPLFRWKDLGDTRSGQASNTHNSSHAGIMAPPAVRPGGSIHEVTRHIGGHPSHGAEAIDGSKAHIHGLTASDHQSSSATGKVRGNHPPPPGNMFASDMATEARRKFATNHYALWNKVYQLKQKYACALTGCKSTENYNLKQLRAHFKKGKVHEARTSEMSAEEQAMKGVELEVNGWLQVNGARDGYGAQNGYRVKDDHGSIRITLNEHGWDETKQVPKGGPPNTELMHGGSGHYGVLVPDRVHGPPGGYTHLGSHVTPGSQGHGSAQHPYQEILPVRSDTDYDGRERWNRSSSAIPHGEPAYAGPSGGSSHGPPQINPYTGPGQAGPVGHPALARGSRVIGAPAGKGSHHGHTGQEHPSGVGGASGNQTGSGTVPDSGDRPWELK